MKRLPIFLPIFPELIQDNRWQQTHLARIPLETLVIIFEYKWLLEKSEAKKQLQEHFLNWNHYHSKQYIVYRNLRRITTFNFDWVTPNGIHVKYLLKWGPGFFTKDLIFTKSLKVKSQHTQYDEGDTRYQIRNNTHLPSVENRYGLPITFPEGNRYN